MLLRHIRYFLAVAEHQNFTRAAAALHVSQPTLSQQMQQLEESLGARLFDRSAKNVRLTDAGEAWKHYAKRALQDIDAGARAVHDVGTLVRGSLRFAAPPTFTPYLIGAAIDRFCRLYPGVTIHFSEIDQDQIEAWLADDKLDVGLGFDSVHLAEFDSTAIFLETLSFVVGATHRCARQAAAMTLTQFQAEPLVLLNQAFATRQHINAYCKAHDIVPHAAVEVNSISALVEVVQRGMLGTVLPNQITAIHQELVAIALEPFMPPRKISVLRRKGAHHSAASTAFIAVLKACFGELAS